MTPFKFTETFAIQQLHCQLCALHYSNQNAINWILPQRVVTERLGKMSGRKSHSFALAWTHTCRPQTDLYHLQWIRNQVVCLAFGLLCMPADQRSLTVSEFTSVVDEWRRPTQRSTDRHVRDKSLLCVCHPFRNYLIETIYVLREHGLNLHIQFHFIQFRANLFARRFSQIVRSLSDKDIQFECQIYLMASNFQTTIGKHIRFRWMCKWLLVGCHRPTESETIIFGVIIPERPSKQKCDQKIVTINRRNRPTS